MIKKHVIDKIWEIKGVLHESALNSPIQSLVSELLTNRMGFLEELFNWMSNQYVELDVQKGPGSEEDNWKFISHAVSKIFDKLHKVRMFGMRFTPVGQVWHCLKALKLQKKLKESKFLEHQIVLNVLHYHLKNDVATRTQFDAERARVTKELAKISKKVHQASSRKESKNDKD